MTFGRDVKVAVALGTRMEEKTMTEAVLERRKRRATAMVGSEGKCEVARRKVKTTTTLRREGEWSSGWQQQCSALKRELGVNGDSYARHSGLRRELGAVVVSRSRLEEERIIVLLAIYGSRWLFLEIYSGWWFVTV